MLPLGAPPEEMDRSMRKIVGVKDHYELALAQFP
jgi:hypothetical protein